MVRQKGLEPPAYCLEGSCSIQLSYWRVYGAGDGNRTHATSLEGWDSTIELHPHLGEALQPQRNLRFNRQPMYLNIDPYICQWFFEIFLFFGKENTYTPPLRQPRTA